MKKILLIAVIACLTFVKVDAQNYKFGKVSIEEVKDNVYEKDTTASAVRLYKDRTTYIDYSQGEGWVVVTEVHERIRIINKDGLNYATKKISLYKSNKSREQVSGIRGYTYNVVNDKLVKTKLKRGSIFKEDISKYKDLKSFTMPNASEGSIVEWEYKITSPFWKIDDLEIQSYIPTVQYKAKVKILEYFKIQ